MKNILFLLVVVLVLCPGVLRAQSQKIGYVISSKIFQELPEAQEAQRKIDAITKPLTDSLESMQRQLQARYEEYQSKEAMLNDAAKKAAQQEIVALEQRMNEFRLQKFGTDGELAREQEKIISPIRDKIKKVIETTAREEKYSFVFDKNEQLQILIYGDTSHDLTYKVLDRLKRGK